MGIEELAKSLTKEENVFLPLVALACDIETAEVGYIGSATDESDPSVSVTACSWVFTNRLCYELELVNLLTLS